MGLTNDSGQTWCLRSLQNSGNTPHLTLLINKNVRAITKFMYRYGCTLLLIAILNITCDF